MGEFKARLQKYLQDRLYPNLPDWPVICFYPMSKRREDENNWYRLDLEERNSSGLEGGHPLGGQLSIGGFVGT